MQVLHEIFGKDWEASYTSQMQSEATRAIEDGKIVLLPQLTFALSSEEEIFFSTEFSHPKFKNISFNPQTGLVRGAKCDVVHQTALKNMMARYANNASQLMSSLFPHYRNAIKIGRTSFRPIEIYGRIPKSYRKDDTRLHVDAFPMSPTQGKRIFRVFTNVNPYGKERIWRVGEPFADVAKQFLPRVKKPWPGRAAILRALRLTKSYCTDYDYAMLQIHNLMKRDLAYQKSATQEEVRFLPNTSWIVQTDSVSHAAMSGQFVFEQTFYLPVESMAYPHLSPLRILEKLAGRNLA